MQGELTCGQRAPQPARVAIPQQSSPCSSRHVSLVGNDLPGAVELLDLLLVPRPRALVADGGLGADHRARRRQLALDDRRDRVPDPLGLGRAAGQVVVHRHGLVRASAACRRTRAGGASLRAPAVFVLRLDAVGVLGRGRLVVDGVEDLAAVVDVGQPGNAPLAAHRSRRPPAPSTSGAGAGPCTPARWCGCRR